LQNTNLFRTFFFKNSYLLVLAAWLITLSFGVDNYWSANSSITKVQKEISNEIQQQEKDFKALVKDPGVISTVASGNFSESFLSGLTSKKYFIFFYTTDPGSQESLLCWNTQQVLPYPSLLYEKRNEGFVLQENGYYVWNRYDLGAIKAIALFPVKWNYFISTDYLPNDFVNDRSITSNYDISARPGKGVAVKSISGKDLFYVYEKKTTQISKNNPVAVLLLILASLVVLLFVHLWASFLATTGRLWKGVLLLLLVILSVRISGYYFPVPLNFRQFELFDPAIYGSNMILRSLGDLLINALLFVWLILFLRHYVHENNVQLRLKSPAARWILLGIGSIVIITVTFTGSSIIRSLVADSQISFDVINFFTLNMYSVTGFVILCCIAIGYFFLCQLIIYFLKPLFSKHFIPLFLFVTVIGLGILSFQVGHISGGFEIFVLLWLLFFLFLLNSTYLNLLASKIISSKLVFWLFFFSVSITGIIVVENNKKELSNREHYAEILSKKADPSSETLINSMITVFRDDYLADHFDRFRQQSTNQPFKDSLLNENITSYTNKFETRVLAYDASEKPLYNDDSTGYNEINAILNTQAKPTGTEGLYYFDESYDMFSYICKKTLKDHDGILLGYVFILASPKKSKREALSPELLSRGTNNSIENSSLYAFAIYNNWKLISIHNDYPFPSVLKKKGLRNEHFERVQKKDHSELWYYAGADKVVVIAKENSLSIESITLFSYLFCSFLLLTALFWIINILIRSGFRINRIRSYWQLSIRNQIHGTIIFISVFSFIIIGFATILFFIIRYENNNREKLSRTIHIMEGEVKNSISKGWNMNDSLQLNEKNYGQGLEEMINKISEIHGVDVNLYDLQGNLRVSSLPLLYVKGIVSTRMHPLAYFHLNNEKEVQFYQKENIGKLQFASNYVPVLDGEGNDYAYLNIPYFTSQSNLRQEISNFLVTIINLNAFIFLIAGIVALFITNRITRSFSVIGDKMKKINLGSRNEAIEWKRNDELGELVNEYNKMVSKLEESANVLARTEREGAWREMARQVAHEIKNPLTPMKLSLQYLQKSIESNAPNIPELTNNVAKTLVEQIDHLNHIAGEFSQFANIGDSKKELFDLNETLRSVLHLYSANDHLQISAQLLDQPIIINADKTHINRLFTNLMLNGIQAVPDQEMARIGVIESIRDGYVLVQISDNGQGIDDTIRPKIFAPNFTTKTSGTGLGLAMCKRMVEQAEGDIWFESNPGKGTSFYVKLPVVA